MARNDTHRERAKEYLLAHPNAPNAEVCREVKVSVRTVTNARGDLLAENLIPPAWGDQKHGRRVNATEHVRAVTQDIFDVKTTSDLNAAVDAEMAKEAARQAAADALADAELLSNGEVDVAKLKKILWRVVHRNTDDRIVVAAASALARIQQEANSRPLGPGKPMTKTEAIARLILMFKAVGVDLVVQALNTWMGKGPTDGTAQTAQPSVAPPSPPQAAGASNDNPQPGTGA